MIEVATEQFQEFVDKAVDSLPETHREAIKNVGFFVMDEPSEEQLERGDVHAGYTLLGLYEGVPLAARQGRTGFMPDKITIFQKPHEHMANSIEELKESIRHTVWHEVAHYFGLDHDAIAKLE
ncbi:MAG: metallopeptidase family protein [Candidatus Saccharimonadales bacterium]